MPYIDVFVDDDQFDRIIVEELDHALSTDQDVELDAEMRRSMMMVRNYFCAKPEMVCLLYTSPSPRDGLLSRMPSSA